MRSLTRFQSALFLVGGLLMVSGMGCFVFIRQPDWALTARLWASVVYLAGAVIFAIMQIMQSYRGEDFVVRRLKNIMTMADLLFVIAGVLMIDSCTMFMRP
ncbi:MAG: hypothetical protein LUC22_06115, partial [Prevotella sp.]|nr:hypothetical protein [Prevotella sp.]